MLCLLRTGPGNPPKHHVTSTVFLHGSCAEFTQIQRLFNVFQRPHLPYSRRTVLTTLTYRTLQFRSHSYLLSLINFNNPLRPFRSSSINLLHVPFTAKATGRKAFWFSTPTVWNSISQNIRLLPSIGSFKRSLKTHLFSLLG